MYITYQSQGSPEADKEYARQVAAVISTAMRETQPPIAQYHITDVAVGEILDTPLDANTPMLSPTSTYTHQIECEECDTEWEATHVALSMLGCPECGTPAG